MPRRCVCPGTFDPITLGHLDVLRRATTLFDEVVVAVLTNPAKRPLFTLEERVAMVRECVADLPVRVSPVTGGLLVDFCRAAGAGAVVKGLRNSSDWDYEQPMAVLNRRLAEVETVFVAADPQWSAVSSTLVKEIARGGGDVSPYLAPGTLARLRARVCEGGAGKEAAPGDGGGASRGRDVPEGGRA